MRPLRALAAIMILTGAALTVYGVAIGEMQVILVILVPVIVASSVIGALAIGSIVVGMVVGMADLFLSASREEGQVYPSNQERASETAKGKEFGGVVLIGPIPIVFGSSRKVAMYAALIAIVILVLMLLALFLGG